MSANTKTYNGSCHCKHITYQVELPTRASAGDSLKLTRCNCTICHKSGFTSLSPPIKKDAFKLLTPAVAKISDDDLIGDYQFNVTTVHRYHCKKCGIQVFGEGRYEFQGQGVNFFSVNVRTLDLDNTEGSDDLDLTKLKVVYWDGLKDNWHAGASDKPYPGGIV